MAHPVWPNDLVEYKINEYVICNIFIPDSSQIETRCKYKAATTLATSNSSKRIAIVLEKMYKIFFSRKNLII
jgi:hypothetical protein